MNSKMISKISTSHYIHYQIKIFLVLKGINYIYDITFKKFYTEFNYAKIFLSFITDFMLFLFIIFIFEIYFKANIF